MGLRFAVQRPISDYGPKGRLVVISRTFDRDLFATNRVNRMLERGSVSDAGYKSERANG